MSVIVDIILGVVIILGTLYGAKKGLIKTVVGFIGLLAILILSYSLKTPIANFLIDNLPFFDFGGKLANLTSLNILLYNVISFIVVFVVLYCLLNVILSLTGFIDTLLKFTVIWIIPSKIGGAIVGLLETVVYLFLILFILAQFNVTNSFIHDSKISNFILNNTPVLRVYLGNAKDAAMDIYAAVEEFAKEEKIDTTNLNLKILQIEINNGLLTKDKANDLIQTGKLKLDNVQVA